MTSTSPFTGFPPEALTFYDGLEEDNSRSYWLAHKQTFESAVREPMAALLAALPEAYHPFHVFRPNRDVRFSKDKSPYKTMHGAGSETAEGIAHYLHVSSAGLLVASGMYMLTPDQLERFRAAVADDASGPRLESAIAAVRKSKIDVDAGHDEPLTTAPRGWSKDHARIELLRWKGCMASTTITSETALASKQLPRKVVDLWNRMLPVDDWLATHVGPPAEPRDLGRRR